jgi:hypothetical protein
MDACGNVVQKGTGDASNRDATEPPPGTGSDQPTGTTENAANVNGPFTINLPAGVKLRDFISDWFFLPTGKFDYWKSLKAIDDKETKFTANDVVPPLKLKTEDAGSWRFDETTKEYTFINLDPKMTINKIIPAGSQNTNPPPGWPGRPFIKLTSDDANNDVNNVTSSGNAYIYYRGVGEERNWLVMRSGKSSKKIKDEKAVKEKEEQEKQKRIERDKSLNVKLFKMDDQDKIEDFEEYFKDYIKKRDDLNLGGAEDYYEVTATKMTYAGNVYNKGQIIRLTE